MVRWESEGEHEINVESDSQISFTGSSIVLSTTFASPH